MVVGAQPNLDGVLARTLIGNVDPLAIDPALPGSIDEQMQVSFAVDVIGAGVLRRDREVLRGRDVDVPAATGVIGDLHCESVSEVGVDHVGLAVLMLGGFAHRHHLRCSDAFAIDGIRRVGVRVELHFDGVFTRGESVDVNPVVVEAALLLAVDQQVHMSLTFDVLGTRGERGDREVGGADPHVVTRPWIGGGLNRHRWGRCGLDVDGFVVVVFDGMILIGMIFAGMVRLSRVRVRHSLIGALRCRLIGDVGRLGCRGGGAATRCREQRKHAEQGKCGETPSDANSHYGVLKKCVLVSKQGLRANQQRRRTTRRSNTDKDRGRHQHSMGNRQVGNKSTRDKGPGPARLGDDVADPTKEANNGQGHQRSQKKTYPHCGVRRHAADTLPRNQRLGGLLGDKQNAGNGGEPRGLKRGSDTEVANLPKDHHDGRDNRNRCHDRPLGREVAMVSNGSVSNGSVSNGSASNSSVSHRRDRQQVAELVHHQRGQRRKTQKHRDVCEVQRVRPVDLCGAMHSYECSHTTGWENCQPSG